MCCPSFLTQCYQREAALVTIKTEAGIPKRKLTEDDVRGIRYGAEVEGFSAQALAAIYNVSRVQIWRILRDKQHKRTPGLRPESVVSKKPQEINKLLLDFLRKKGV